MSSFSLVRGGPLYRLAQKLRLVRGDAYDTTRLATAFVAATWGQLVAVGVIDRLVTGRWDPLLSDFAIHVRVLVGLPLVFLGDEWLDRTTRAAAESFRRGGLARDPERAEQVFAAAERMRDSLAPELVLVAIALLLGESVLWSDKPWLGLLRPTARSHTLVAVWNAAIVSPIVLFIALRWLYRWFIWSAVVVRLAALPLRLLTTHPDGRGGTGVLAKPTTGFAPGVTAFASVQAAAWATRAIDEGVPIQTFGPQLATLLFGAILLVLGPLVAWATPLWRTRLRDEVDYSALAMEYMRSFDRKWVRERDPSQELLGTSDIQSLADIGNSFAVVRKMSLLPFDSRAVGVVAAAVLAPCVPVVLLEVPLGELLRRLMTAAVGGGLR